MSDSALSDLIEHERTELMQIHAMVRCLNDVLLYADDDDSSLHADVALVIARLLNDCVGRLEKVRARVMELEQAAQALPPANQVRELRASYRVSPRPSDCGQLDDGSAPQRDVSEPWLMVRDCSGVVRTGDYSCRPNSRSWVS